MDDYKFLNKTMYFPKEKILVMSDLHFGYEEELNNQGIAIPRRMVSEIIKDIEQILNNIKDIQKIVILGDIRHSFGGIVSQERKDINTFFKFIRGRFPKSRIILTKGNHDTMIEVISAKENWKNIEIVDYFLYKDTLFFHGHWRFFKKFEEIIRKAKRLVVGHFHPAIDLSDGEKSERFKCFVVGKLKRKEIVFVPSFFPLVEGTNILRNSEFVRLGVKHKRVYVVSPDKKVLDFGEVNW